MHVITYISNIFPLNSRRVFSTKCMKNTPNSEIRRNCLAVLKSKLNIPFALLFILSYIARFIFIYQKKEKTPKKGEKSQKTKEKQ